MVNKSYNLVREVLPNSPVDDQGLMDVANQLTGLWSTEITRLRFIGFRMASLPAAAVLNLNLNEIGIIINLFSANSPIINTVVINNAQNTFGAVFNRVAANAVGACYVQYALFTYQ